MSQSTNDNARTQMTEADEAQLRVTYKNLLRNHGRVALLQCIDTMQRCTAVALEVLKENWEKI